MSPVKQPSLLSLIIRWIIGILILIGLFLLIKNYVWPKVQTAFQKKEETTALFVPIVTPTPVPTANPGATPTPVTPAQVPATATTPAATATPKTTSPSAPTQTGLPSTGPETPLVVGLLSTLTLGGSYYYSLRYRIQRAVKNPEIL